MAGVNTALSDDLLRHIFALMRDNDSDHDRDRSLCRCAEVCLRWQRLASEDAMWRPRLASLPAGIPWEPPVAAGTPVKTVYGAYAALHLEALAILSQENHRSFERDAYNKVRFYRQRLRELEKDARMSRRRVEQLVQIRDQHLAAVALASCEAADARARGDWVLRPPREPPSKAVVQAAENEVVDAQTLAEFRDGKVAEAKEQLRSNDAQLQASKELRLDAERREARAGKALTPSKPWHAPRLGEHTRGAVARAETWRRRAGACS